MGQHLNARDEIVLRESVFTEDGKDGLDFGRGMTEETDYSINVTYLL